MLREMLNKFVFVYVDDVLVFARSLQEHDGHMKRVLQRLLENKLFVIVDKGDVDVQEVHLGVCDQRGRHPDGRSQGGSSHKMASAHFPKQLQHFVGFAQF